ncbi:ATP-binding protein [Vibrio anguillarum]|nr:ATP-binding protein [Vibrio anguillarum]MBF4447696.1 ATP-binding protein [Vibrio anguillarum]
MGRLRKTSMLEQVLNYFPSVIEHTQYRGQSLEVSKQVVWIKVDCPDKSSVRDLCEEILLRLDLATGVEQTKPAGTIGSLMRQIEQRIKINYLGILVIDEMQRLELKRTRGENNLLNFLHSLVNKLGIPLLFCGNPPFDETLSKKLKAARRAESGGYWKMYPLRRDSKSKDWDAFISELWDLQWTNIKTPLTEELMSKMYELSLGNLDMCCRIYREAQRSVIGSGDERINATVLENAYYYACALSNETAEVNDLREQLGIHLPRRNKSVTEKDEDNTKPKPKPKQKPAILGDITRAQHPEFEMLIRDVLGMVNLPIKSADLFQQLSESEETYNSTSLQGILYENPLEDLR